MSDSLSHLSISMQRIIRKVKNNLQAKTVMVTNPRVTTKTWRIMLLNNVDTVVVGGTVRTIVAKSLGAGVYELSLKIKELVK